MKNYLILLLILPILFGCSTDKEMQTISSEINQQIPPDASSSNCDPVNSAAEFENLRNDGVHPFDLISDATFALITDKLNFDDEDVYHGLSGGLSELSSELNDEDMVLFSKIMTCSDSWIIQKSNGDLIGDTDRAFLDPNENWDEDYDRALKHCVERYDCTCIRNGDVPTAPLP